MGVREEGILKVDDVGGTAPLPTGAATEAKQTQPGVDIGDVTINNAGGLSAVTIQDGGNSITVDGSVAVTGALTDAQLRATVVPVTLGALVSHVIVDSMPAGGSGLTDAELRASAVPVSLATVPSHAVTNVGTFAVQVTSAPSTAVTGTFWQATQPVSGTVTTAPPANASTNVAQLAGTATAVNSGLKDAGTLRVVLATDQPSLTNKLLVTPDSVALPANQSVNVSQMAGVAPSLNTGVRDAGTQRVTVATNDVVPVSGTVTVTPPTLTKGTQGATGFSTQDLKDAGRNQTNFFHAIGIAATGAEVMQTLTGYKAGAAVAATATPAVVTAGKTYRITSITAVYQSLAAAGAAIIRLRANLSGVGVVGSPLVANWEVGSGAVAAGVTTTEALSFPEGLEFAAGTGIAVGVIGMTAAQVAGAAGFVMITISGFEY